MWSIRDDNDDEVFIEKIRLSSSQSLQSKSLIKGTI